MRRITLWTLTFVCAILVACGASETDPGEDVAASQSPTAAIPTTTVSPVVPTPIQLQVAPEPTEAPTPIQLPVAPGPTGQPTPAESTSTSEPTEQSSPPPPEGEPGRTPEAISNVARVEDPSTAGLGAVVSGSNDFGANLYRVLAAESPDTNVVLSPVSVSQVLAMVQAGASGATEEQLANVFGYPVQELLHPAMNALDRALESSNLPATDRGEVILEAANSAWGQDGATFGQAYLDTLAANYGAGLGLVNFAGDPDGAADQINAWANEKTRGRIPTPVDPMIFTPLTRLVLVNAVYLKATWQTPFAEASTFDDFFIRADSSEVLVPMMHAQQTVGRVGGPDFLAVRLPYVGNELAMYLVLPDRGAMASIEQQLSAPFFKDLALSLELGRADLTIPKWDFESKIPLNDPLLVLGLGTGQENAGDLEAIGPRIEIGTVFQIANITVTEESTEAAAVTVAELPTTDGGPPPPEFQFRADRPFIFAVVHEPTGTVLFMGKVADPSLGE